MNPIITLISDWRLRDSYVAMFKGQILSLMPDATIIDISHHIELYDNKQTAFLMRQSYGSFPQETIHLLLTNASVNSNFSPVLLEHKGHYFVGEDNGVFCQMFGQEMELKGVQFKNTAKVDSIQQILKLTEAIVQKKVDKVTQPYEQFQKMYLPIPFNMMDTKTIEGEIVYIDANMNAITNIPNEMFKETVKGSFTAEIQTEKTDWKEVAYHDHYQKDDRICLVPNSLGCLEITYYQGKVAMLANLKVGDKVVIHY